MARIIYGHRYYGRVDRARGLFHVATLFFHVNYFPLYPVETQLIREHAGGWDCSGPSIGLRLKSVLVGYLRGWLHGVCCFAAFCGGFLCGLAAYPLSAVYTVIPAVVLGCGLAWPLGFVLTEAPPPGRTHPAAERLLWHVGVTGLTVLIGGAQLVVAAVVAGAVDARYAEPLHVLPLAACGLLAAAQLMSYGYRLSLFLTPADHERALDLAAAFHVPRRSLEPRRR